MRGVVCLSIFDWWCHSHGHSDFQLARALARRMPVLFVNSIGMRAPHPGRVTSPMRRIARKVLSTIRFMKFADRASSLTVLTPVSAPIYGGPIEFLIRKLLAFQVSTVCRALGLDRPIIIVTLPTFARLAFCLNSERVLYYRSDRHSAFEGVDEDLVRASEKLLFERAHAVLYSSQTLFDDERASLDGRALLVGHGLDATLFSPDGPAAPELRGLPRPRVGFFGDLRSRSLDFDLIAGTAKLCPSIQFVLGGEQLDDLGVLRTLANVHILPPCPHERMPGRWRALDAAILPYRRSAWQDASEPIKLNEIIATGLPAVGTALPAFTRRAGEIDVAEGPEAFAAALCRILASPDAGRGGRRGQGMTTWDAIAERIIGLSGESPATPRRSRDPAGSGLVP